jgi:hypothetical protein
MPLWKCAAELQQNRALSAFCQIEACVYAISVDTSNIIDGIATESYLGCLRRQAKPYRLLRKSAAAATRAVARWRSSTITLPLRWGILVQRSDTVRCRSCQWLWTCPRMSIGSASCPVHPFRQLFRNNTWTCTQILWAHCNTLNCCRVLIFRDRVGCIQRLRELEEGSIFESSSNESCILWFSYWRFEEDSM